MPKITDRIKEAVADAIDRTTHLDVARATHVIAEKFGLNQRLINYTHIELRNKLNEYGYKATPYNRRILFLPHCLKNSKHCKAGQNDEGLQCKRCEKCNISELIGIADDLKYYKVFVAPGGSMVQNLVKKYKPGATVGVCCYHEANLAFDSLRRMKIHSQVVLLLHDGCKDTKANVAEVREKMELINKSLLPAKALGKNRI